MIIVVKLQDPRTYTSKFSEGYARMRGLLSLIHTHISTHIHTISRTKKIEIL